MVLIPKGASLWNPDLARAIAAAVSRWNSVSTNHAWDFYPISGYLLHPAHPRRIASRRVTLRHVRPRILQSESAKREIAAICLPRKRRADRCLAQRESHFSQDETVRSDLACVKRTRSRDEEEDSESTSPGLAPTECRRRNLSCGRQDALIEAKDLPSLAAPDDSISFFPTATRVHLARQKNRNGG